MKPLSGAPLTTDEPDREPRGHLGVLQERDCANDGLACDYIDEEIGWYCTQG